MAIKTPGKGSAKKKAGTRKSVSAKSKKSSTEATRFRKKSDGKTLGRRKSSRKKATARKSTGGRKKAGGKKGSSKKKGRQKPGARGLPGDPTIPDLDPEESE